jgi:hypothetical protein
MVDLFIFFEREEVQFIHDDEEFIYNFHRFDSGKITFKRLDPRAPVQEPEVIIYPPGTTHLACIVIIVLYKSVAEGQQMNGTLEEVLKTMLNLHPSKEILDSNLGGAITSFRVKKTPIAVLEDVMEFVKPHTPWAVHSSHYKC